MKKIIISSVAALLALGQTLLAESPAVIPLPSQQTIVTDKTDVLEPVKMVPTSTNPNEYSVSLFANKRNICKGVIIAPSWVLTAKHCTTRKLNFVTESKKKNRVKIVRKFKFKNHADIGLLQIANAPFGNRMPVRLLSKSLLPSYGVLDGFKVTHNSKKGVPTVYKNLKIKPISKKRLRLLNPAGKPGSSGSPWLVKTDIGDVVVAVTHGGGFGPQVSQAKEWIDSTVSRYTPSENVNWLSDTDILLRRQ